MFEDMTFENIMNLMMEEMPNDLDTSEGSLIYHACAKQAARLEEAYIQLSQIVDNQYPDTADLDHLILFGQERGIYIKEATSAIFEGKFNVPIEIGSEFSGDDYNYIVTELMDDIEHTYKLECEDAGKEPNGWIGELMALDDIDGLETAELTKLLVEGTDEENEESYRMRLLDSFEIKPFAGNRAYYIQEIGKLDGVGGVKVYRRTGSNILIVIISETFDQPSEELLSDVQTQVDPVQNSGEGIGIAPIGHSVMITGVEEQVINVSAEISYDSGHSYEGLKAQIEEAVENYFLGLRKMWNNAESIIVRKAGIENEIYNIDGIIDVTNVLLNYASENIILQENIIPVKGEIICN